MAYGILGDKDSGRGEMCSVIVYVKYMLTENFKKEQISILHD